MKDLTPDQERRMKKIEEQSRKLVFAIEFLVPPCPERSLAIRDALAAVVSCEVAMRNNENPEEMPRE